VRTREICPPPRQVAAYYVIERKCQRVIWALLGSGESAARWREVIPLDAMKPGNVRNMMRVMLRSVRITQRAGTSNGVTVDVADQFEAGELENVRRLDVASVRCAR
jgi:hypothetical protein